MRNIIRIFDRVSYMKIVLFALIVLLCCLWAVPAYGADNPVAAKNDSVTVKIVDFPVLLNGVQVDNTFLSELSKQIRELSFFLQCPVFVYKDITYIPMTWYVSNLLNLSVNWSPESGLDISQGNPDEWKNFRYDSVNELVDGKHEEEIFHIARIVSFPIVINGKLINNEEEPYPFLIFRDIVYLPLTWHFAVDELGWEYSFSREEGLRIGADNAFCYFEPVPEDRYPEDSSIIWYHIFIKGDLRIWQEFHAPYRVWQYGEMYISKAGEVERVEQINEQILDGFGSFEPPGDIRVENDWAYTVYWNRPEPNSPGEPIRVRVNIHTKAVEVLN